MIHGATTSVDPKPGGPTTSVDAKPGGVNGDLADHATFCVVGEDADWARLFGRRLAESLYQALVDGQTRERLRRLVDLATREKLDAPSLARDDSPRRGSGQGSLGSGARLGEPQRGRPKSSSRNDATVGRHIVNAMDSAAASARFEQLFRAHYERVLSYARRRTQSSVADDAVAETFLIAWRRLESIPRDELPWLLGVARRVLANQRRRDATQDRVALRFATEPVASDVRDSTLDPELGLAFSQLGKRDQELVRLIAWEGLAPAEAWSRRERRRSRSRPSCSSEELRIRARSSTRSTSLSPR